MYNRSLKIAFVGLLLGVLCGAVAPSADQPESAVVDPITLRVALAEERERADSREREIQDLLAQQSMANSAQRLLEPSWAQVWIAAFGTVGLCISLAFSYLALSGTRKAMRLQTETAHTHLRAYLGIRELELKNLAVGLDPYVTLALKNYGVTPAANLVERTGLSIQPISTVYDYSVSHMDSGVTVLPGQDTNTVTPLGRRLTEADIKKIIEDKTHVIIFSCEIEYESMGQVRRTETSVRFQEAGKDHRLLPNKTINT